MPIKALRTFIGKVKELVSFTEDLPEEEKHVPFEKATKLKLEALKAFQETMNHVSKAEHEKSHLLQSYGSILLALERQPQL